MDMMTNMTTLMETTTMTHTAMAATVVDMEEDTVVMGMDYMVMVGTAKEATEVMVMAMDCMVLVDTEVMVDTEALVVTVDIAFLDMAVMVMDLVVMAGMVMVAMVNTKDQRVINMARSTKSLISMDMDLENFLNIFATDILPTL